MLKKIVLSFMLGAGVIAQCTVPAAALPQQQKAVSVNPFQVSPEIQKALKKFSAFNSRLELGMNYQKYLDELGELNILLDEVPQEARKNISYMFIDLAFSDYKNALNVWRRYIEGDGSHGFIAASSVHGPLLIDFYGVETTDISGSQQIYLKDALSKMWNHAGIKINQAKALSSVK